MRAAAGAALVAWVLGAASVAAQPNRSVQTALVPDSVTVGDVFHAAIQIRVPAETNVVFPDTLEVSGNVEMAGRRTIRVDTLGPGQLQITAVYPLSGWKPGLAKIPPAEIRLQSGQVVSTLTADFRDALIVSVLPPDTAGVQPKPARDVLGPSRLWWPLLLALLLALAIVSALIWWWRRRQSGVEEAVIGPLLSPREAALAALEYARTSGLVEAGEFKAFYSLVTDALRQYLERLENDWGADLTTTELAGRLYLHHIDAHAAQMIGLLKRADLVKFARRRTTRDEAWQDWESARNWVQSFEWPLPAPVEQAAAA